MSSRTPRPRTPPTTLLGLVLDLEARLHGGDALDEVVLPHDEWVPLVEAAQAEHERELDASGFRGSETKGALCRTLGISENSTDSELFIAVKNLAHPAPLEEVDEDNREPDPVLVAEATRQSLLPSAHPDRLPPRGGKRSAPKPLRLPPSAKAKPKKKAPFRVIPGVTPFIAPFHVREGKKKLEGVHKTSDAAIEAAQQLGLLAFDVIDGRGRTPYSYRWSAGMPKPKPSKPKKAAAPKPRGAAASFMREYPPSPQLAQIVGPKPLARTQLIKKLWEYFKKNKLNDGQFFHLNDKLKAVYGNKKTIKMVEVSKAFSHLEGLESHAPKSHAPKKAPKKNATTKPKVNMDERVKAELERGLALDAGRRLNGAGWRRAAKAAREENSQDICHHCGAGPDDNAGDIKFVHAQRTLCGGCRIRLRDNPGEFDRHKEPVQTGSRKAKKPAKAPVQQTLEETIARAAIAAESPVAPTEATPRAPSRATKKFPLQSGLTERCTECGAELGDHSGTKCPFPATPPPPEILAAPPPESPPQEMQ